MSKTKILKNDLEFLLFKEIYLRLNEPKAKRQALNLLHSCIEVFAKNGIYGSSVKSLARHAAVTPQKLRYYLGDYDEIVIYCVKFTRYLYQSYVLEKLQASNAKDQSELISVYIDSCVEWPSKMREYTSFWIRFLAESRVNELYKGLNTESVEVGFNRLVQLLESCQSSLPNRLNSKYQVSEKSFIIHTLITGAILTESTESRPGFDGERELIKRVCRDLLIL